MSSQIVYDNGSASCVVDPVTFLNISGAQADPSSVSLTVTDSLGDISTYSGSTSPPGAVNEIIRVNTGNYTMTLSNLTTPGQYSFVWVGTGNGVNQVTAGSFRVMPLTALNGQLNWYCGLEEFKSRNSILATSTADDYEISMAIQAATGWINRYCGTHFFRVTEARTFPVTDIYCMPIDQIVPGSISAFQLDYDGDGVFETNWTENVNYQVMREGETYNQNYAGIKRPFDFVRAILNPAPGSGGMFFPFVWPFTHNDRVKITGTWGWQQIPDEVTQACLIMATQLFREKDSPWGTVGTGDMGVIRTSQSPYLIELLRPFINPRKKVGI